MALTTAGLLNVAFDRNPWLFQSSESFCRAASSILNPASLLYISRRPPSDDEYPTGHTSSDSQNINYNNSQKSTMEFIQQMLTPSTKPHHFIDSGRDAANKALRRIDTTPAIVRSKQIIISPRTMSATIAESSRVVASLAISPRSVRSIPRLDEDNRNRPPKAGNSNSITPVDKRQNNIVMMPHLPLTSISRDSDIGSPSKRLCCYNDGPSPSPEVPSTPDDISAPSPVSHDAMQHPLLNTVNCCFDTISTVAHPSVTTAAIFPSLRPGVPGLRLNAVTSQSDTPDDIPNLSSSRHSSRCSMVSTDRLKSRLSSSASDNRPIGVSRLKLASIQQQLQRVDTCSSRSKTSTFIPSARTDRPNADDRIDSDRRNGSQESTPSFRECREEVLSSDELIEEFCHRATEEEKEEEEAELSKETLLEMYRHTCSEVVPGARLYISGVSVSQNYQLMKDFGITHIINVAGDTCQNSFSEFHYLTYILQVSLLLYESFNYRSSLG